MADEKPMKDEVPPPEFVPEPEDTGEDLKDPEDPEGDLPEPVEPDPDAPKGDALIAGGHPTRSDGVDPPRVEGHGVTEGEPTVFERPASTVSLQVEGNPPVVVRAPNDPPIVPLPAGPVEGREGPGHVQVVGPHGEGIQLRTPIEKGPQEGRIGVVDRELTEAGEAIGIMHGVVSHELKDGNPGPDPIERCPECGNVNLAYHNKARTSAHCVHCLWQSGNLHASGNPSTRIPGVHEVDGVHADAGEIPVGKLEGALDMDPLEAKEGVRVGDDRFGEVTSFHTGDDGLPVKQTNRFIEPANEPA